MLKCTFSILCVGDSIRLTDRLLAYEGNARYCGDIIAVRAIFRPFSRRDHNMVLSLLNLLTQAAYQQLERLLDPN